MHQNTMELPVWDLENLRLCIDHENPVGAALGRIPKDDLNSLFLRLNQLGPSGFEPCIDVHATNNYKSKDGRDFVFEFEKIVRYWSSKKVVIIN